VAGDFTKAYRSYLAELERECRQFLGVISVSIFLLGCFHPFFLLLGIPATIIACRFIYREAQNYLRTLLFRTDLLKRAISFEDYDPDLLDAMELERLDSYRLDSSGRLRPSALAGFWHSFEASCRYLSLDAISGYHHLVWMTVPLATLTIGLLAAPGLVERWNYLHLPQWLLQVMAWLLGIGAATLGKYLIELALVTTAWDAVIRLPAEEPDAAAREAGREEFFSWKMPLAEPGGSTFARRNGSNP
jgi:hypothetical protein